MQTAGFMSAQSWSICPQKWYSNEASKSHVKIINLTIVLRPFLRGKKRSLSVHKIRNHSSLKLWNPVFQRANFIAAEETIASLGGILKGSLY